MRFAAFAAAMAPLRETAIKLAWREETLSTSCK
jgi:hypothetical protein